MPTTPFDLSSGPYSGLRVLDLSQGIAGPYCAQILWQQGADVVKVEPPDGDWGRHVGVVRDGQSALSISYNVGKRGVCVDARQPRGKALLAQMAQRADIVIQNFRPGVAERMGVGYDSLAERNPGLVYVSISGYGPDGPSSNAPASDSVMQADSGLMFANQTSDGEPRRIGMLMADIATALYAVQATSAALYQHARSGRGQHVRLSLFQACAALQVNDILAFGMTGERQAGAVSAPNGVFATADVSLSVLALNNDQFARLCRALDRTDWLADPALASNAGRMAQRERLHRELSIQLAARPAAHWVERLAREDVLHAQVRDYDSLAAHPQAAHIGLLEPLAQPGGESLPFARVPGAGARRPLRAAPAIGQHTVAVLTEWGVPAPDIQSMLDAGVLRQAAAPQGDH
ncbi:CaiB/BaiF CoA transferase family protein [Achromobacter deleyi]|uniref:CaiB/BaiF CoA transferase family protein n=1 Tax=Achromobacter deleyi TaxID=1353891 RepID=UPI001490C711|nr:CoA transferase [Achromobacter deleyi]QVQ26938.1 CoA transferase [Achromobacter deleyi]UIP22513.1 CoA transferase [Achromobacter deleyi]